MINNIPFIDTQFKIILKTNEQTPDNKRERAPSSVIVHRRSLQPREP